MFKIFCLWLSLLAWVPTVVASAAPAQSVNVIIPFSPGSGNEKSFRIVAAEIERRHGVKFNVLHRPGMNGNQGMNEFVEKPADGSWIAVPTCQNSFMAKKQFADKIRYDAMTLTYITHLAQSPLVLVSSSNSSVSTVEDFVGRLRQSSPPNTFASGSPNHELVFNYIKTQLPSVNTGNFTLVRHKSPNDALTGIAGGHVEFGLASFAVAEPLIKSGHVKALGVLSSRSITGHETVPLVNRTIPGLVSSACFDVVLPPNTNTNIQAWFNRVFVEALTDPKIMEQMQQNFFVVDRSLFNPQAVLKDRMAMAKKWEQFVPVAE